jgi:hypothetical protein
MGAKSLVTSTASRLSDRREGSVLAFPARADDRPPAAASARRSLETPLPVQFVGLDEMAQQRAIASFPGGRRCVLVGA